MSNEMREGWQMEGAFNQRRWHYIEGSTSICGRFGFYMGEVGQALQPGNPGSDCAECVRRVARKIEKAKSADLVQGDAKLRGNSGDADATENHENGS